MNVYELSRSRALQLNANSKWFQEGQIVRGKILKLYPFNQAAIQIGHKTLIAQLEAPLVIGENYYLNVDKIDELVHLKVISERLQLNEKENAMTLLKQLGLKASKLNSDFVHLLLKEKIPFTKNQLQKAFPLLSNMKNDIHIVHTLKEVIKNELPITKNLIKAVHTNHSSQLTDLLRALLQFLENKDSLTLIERQIINHIQPFMEQSNQNTFGKKIHQTKERQNTIFYILKAIGAINIAQKLSPLNQEQTNRMIVQDSLKQLDTLWINRTTVKQVAEEIVAAWKHRLPLSTGQSQEIPPKLLDKFKSETISKLKTIPESSIRLSLINMLKNNTHVVEFFQTLHILSSPHTYHLVREILTTPFIHVRDQFIHMVKQFTTVSGITYEHALNDNIPIQETTIKSLLIQLLNNNVDTNEQATKLLHFLNGMQLKSIQETSHFVQASLILPGEKWGLHKDLSLEFSGKKNKNGQIDPDNCRILFFLKLNNMKETIVVMNVQKRFVNVTIFNDNLDMQRSHLENLLKKGLKKLDYHLTNVTIKPYDNENNKNNPSITNYTNEYTSERIDFRI